MTSTNFKAGENLPGSLAHILKWEALGLKIDELWPLVYHQSEKYHAIVGCASGASPKNAPGDKSINQVRPSVTLKEFFEKAERGRVSITLKELFEMQEASLLCMGCLEYLQFDFKDSQSAKFNCSDIGSIANWIARLQDFKLEDKSVKSIGKAISQREDLARLIGLLQTSFKVPGSLEIANKLTLDLEAFDQEVKDFQESPKGLKEILKHASREVFEMENIFDLLPSKSKNGKNDEAILRETAKLKKSLRKKAESLGKTNFYSLCTNPKLVLSAIADDEIDLRESEGNLVAAGLSCLIAEKWLHTEGELVVLPYVIMLYIKRQLLGARFEAINLKEKPSERLVECMRALYSEQGEGISFFEAYKAAVAID